MAYPARPVSAEATALLLAVRKGEPHASDHLFACVYDELRRLAQTYIAAERAGVTLSATGLVHEAYLNLAGEAPGAWENRAHFFAIASRVMRRVLIGSARRRNAAKRGGGTPDLALDECGLPK